MQVLRGIFKSSTRFIKPSLFLNKSHTPKFFCSFEENPFPVFSNFTPPDAKRLDAGPFESKKIFCNSWIDLKVLAEFDDYKEGLRLLIDKKYDISESFFKKALEAVQAENVEFNSKVVAHVMSK